MFEMSRLRTPIITIVTGEGGSGGALGIALADRVAMLEYAWYSVISPEGCSGILWKGNENAPEAADALKLTSKHLKQLGIIDAVIPEPLGGAHRDPHTTAHTLEQYIAKTLNNCKRVKIETLLERRYEKFRNIGEYIETARRAAKASA
jgi:acetyl-CoA carboxylase carboxyl transferase subunit alpha